jgi:hypothetical protein
MKRFNRLSAQALEATTWLVEDPRRSQVLFLVAAALIAIAVAALAGLIPAVELWAGLAGGGSGGTGFLFDAMPLLAGLAGGGSGGSG